LFAALLIAYQTVLPSLTIPEKVFLPNHSFVLSPLDHHARIGYATGLQRYDLELKRELPNSQCKAAINILHISGWSVSASAFISANYSSVCLKDGSP
jgi:hypothetical protein